MRYTSDGKRLQASQPGPTTKRWQRPRPGRWRRGCPPGSWAAATAVPTRPRGWRRSWEAPQSVDARAVRADLPVVMARVVFVAR